MGRCSCRQWELVVDVAKFSHTRFEPAGFTGNPEVPMAKSILDYLFRWMELRFAQPIANPALAKQVGAEATKASAAVTASGAPPCSNCGAIMTRAGACYRCTCGSSSGCG